MPHPPRENGRRARPVILCRNGAAAPPTSPVGVETAARLELSDTTSTLLAGLVKSL